MTRARFARTLAHVHPVLLRLSLGTTSVPFYAYGAMLGISIVAGLYLVMALGLRDGFTRGALVRCFVPGVLAALAGARLLFLLTNPAAFHGVGDLLRPGGGLVAYGAVVGGIAGIALVGPRVGVPTLTFVDYGAIGTALAIGFTRIGCLLAGCDFGQPFDGPWAVSFPRGSPAFAQHVASGFVSPDALRSLPVHPTQIYESLAGFAVFALLLALRRRRLARGSLIAVFAVAYGALRFLIELVRGDLDRGSVGSLSTSQFIALASALCGIALLVTVRRRARNPSAVRSHEE